MSDDKMRAAAVEAGYASLPGYVGASVPQTDRPLTEGDHAVIARCVDRQPKLYVRGQHEGYYLHSDVADLIDMVGRLARAATSGAGEGEGLPRVARLTLEDAEALERNAEEADDNQWQDWAATMRQAAQRIRRELAALASPPVSERERELEAEVARLRVIAEGLCGAMSWVDYPFVENNTPEDEIRQRLGFMQKDAEPHRRALTAQPAGDR